MRVLRGFTRLYIAAYALWILGLAVFIYFDDPANSARTGFDYELSKLGEEEIDTAQGRNTREIELPSKWVVQVPLSWPMSVVDSYVHNIASQRPELYRSGGKAQSNRVSKGKQSAAAAQIQALFNDPDFAKLSPEAQKIVVQRKVPSYAALSPEAQDYVFNKLSAKPEPIDLRIAPLEVDSILAGSGKKQDTDIPSEVREFIDICNNYERKKLTVEEFAQVIRAKYPKDYDNDSDDYLVRAVLEKYPVCLKMVDDSHLDPPRQLRTLLFEQRRIALTRQRDEMTNFRLVVHSLTTWAGWSMVLFVPLGLFLFLLATGYSLRWIYRGFAGN